MNWDLVAVIVGLGSAIVAQYVQLTNKITRGQAKQEYLESNIERLEIMMKEHNDKLERAMADYAKKFDQVVEGISEIKRLLAKSGIE